MSGPWITDQDEEDYEQELRIKEWLDQSQGPVPSEFDFKHISSKGTARNTLVRAAFSLDQQVTEDSAGTFADLIAGSDGRDLYCGEEPGRDEIIDAYLSCLGLDEEISEWVIKRLKLWASRNNWHFEKFLTDLEWERL